MTYDGFEPSVRLELGFAQVWRLRPDIHDGRVEKSGRRRGEVRW